MIGLLLPLRWNFYPSGGAPAVFQPADVYSYFYSTPESSVFMSVEDFVPTESLPESPPVLAEAEPLTFYSAGEESVFASSPETSEFGGADD